MNINNIIYKYNRFTSSEHTDKVLIILKFNFASLQINIYQMNRMIYNVVMTMSQGIKCIFCFVI